MSGSRDSGGGGCGSRHPPSSHISHPCLSFFPLILLISVLTDSECYLRIQRLLLYIDADTPPGVAAESLHPCNAVTRCRLTNIRLDKLFGSAKQTKLRRGWLRPFPCPPPVPIGRKRSVGSGRCCKLGEEEVEMVRGGQVALWQTFQDKNFMEFLLFLRNFNIGASKKSLFFNFSSKMEACGPSPWPF